MSKRLQWVLFSGFIAIGIINNIIGPLLPSIREDIRMSYSQAGLLLSGQFIGMLLTALLGGYLMDRFGKKPFLLSGGVLLSAGVLGCMLGKDFPLVYIFNLLTGVGFGIYEVGINALCADYAGSSKGSDLNFLHFFYGIGAISGPVLALFSVNYLGSWRLCFGIAALFPLLTSLLLFPLKLSKHPQSTSTSQSASATNSSPYKSMFLWAAGLAAFFYVGIEVSTGGWAPEFWKNTVPDSMLPASLATTIFWLSLTLGRLFSGFIADRMGLIRYLVASSIGTLLLSLLWSILPVGIWTIATIFIIGLFLSGQFPTLIAVVTTRFPERTGSVTALASVFASLGGFFLPALVGKTADIQGIGILPLMVFAMAAFLVLFMQLLRKGFSGSAAVKTDCKQST